MALGSRRSPSGCAGNGGGFVSEAEYQLQPTLWTDVQTWRAMRDAVRPELRGQPDAINAVAVTGSGADLCRPGRRGSGNHGADRRTDRPGNPRCGAAALHVELHHLHDLAVAVLVVGLFFALVVLEKRELFAALKALVPPLEIWASASSFRR